MKLINTLILSVAALALTACGGSGNGGLTHSQLASDFVASLNYDLNYDVEIVKTHTRQYNYVVVYDYDLDSYDAYNLSYYYPGDNISYYLDDYEYTFFYDLDYNFGNVYTDYITGITFSKTKMTTADNVKAQELIDGIKVKKATKQLTVQFGLAPARAKEVAGLALQLNNSDKATMTTYQYDQYSKAILGSSYTEIQSALADKISGNNASLDKVFSKAAKVNGVSKKSVEKLADLFIKN